MPEKEASSLALNVLFKRPYSIFAFRLILSEKDKIPKASEVAVECLKTLTEQDFALLLNSPDGDMVRKAAEKGFSMWGNNDLV